MKNVKDKLYGFIAGLTIGAAVIGIPVANRLEKDREANQELTSQVEYLTGQLDSIGNDLVWSVLLRYDADCMSHNRDYFNSLTWLKENAESIQYDPNREIIAAKFKGRIPFPQNGLLFPQYHGNNLLFEANASENSPLFNTEYFIPGSTVRFGGFDTKLK